MNFLSPMGDANCTAKKSNTKRSIIIIIIMAKVRKPP